MNYKELNIIKERLNKTTKGNWKFGITGTLHSTETHESILFIGKSGNIVMKYIDMKFIENAKQDMEYLISEVERLKSIVGEN